jgi:hypothetical protein
MCLPTLRDLAPASDLHTWLRHYCRLGYEVTLACRGPQDPDPLCQRLAARREALCQALRQQLRRDYGLDEPQAERLLTQWSRQLFDQLLAQDAMRNLDLGTAFQAPLPA